MRNSFVVAGTALFLSFAFSSLVQAHSLHLKDVSRTAVVDLFVDRQPQLSGVGEFTVNVYNDDGEALLSPDTGIDFSAFCIDIDQGISTDLGAVPVDLVRPSETQGGLEAAWLMENWQQYTDPGAGQLWSAGLQVAIWEVTKDADVGHQYDLEQGDFMLLGAYGFESENLSAAVYSLADTYLDSLVAHFDPQGLDELYTAAISPEYQDVMIKAPIWEEPVPTPEPGTFLLFGAGLAGLFALARKRFQR